MNIPNSLTIFRIILVPVIVILLMQGSHAAALILFAVAGITDGLDGFFARTLRQKTELGSYLDPLADKALIISSFIALSMMEAIPGWLTVIVISRECIILAGVLVLFLMSVPFDVRPALVSKINTVLQIITVLAVLVLLAVPGVMEVSRLGVLFWATAVFTVASGLNYIFTGIRYINRHSDETRSGEPPAQDSLDGGTP